MWDVPVIMDVKIIPNRPAGVLLNEKWKACLLIDIILTGDSDVNTK